MNNEYKLYNSLFTSIITFPLDLNVINNMDNFTIEIIIYLDETSGLKFQNNKWTTFIVKNKLQYNMTAKSCINKMIYCGSNIYNILIFYNNLCNKLNINNHFKCTELINSFNSTFNKCIAKYKCVLSGVQISKLIIEEENNNNNNNNKRKSTNLKKNEKKKVKIFHNTNDIDTKKAKNKQYESVKSFLKSNDIDYICDSNNNDFKFNDNNDINNIDNSDNNDINNIDNNRF